MSEIIPETIRAIADEFALSVEDLAIPISRGGNFLPLRARAARAKIAFVLREANVPSKVVEHHLNCSRETVYNLASSWKAGPWRRNLAS